MLHVLAFTLACTAILATLVPFIRTDIWWIRAFDYPKPQVLIISGAAMVLWIVSGSEMYAAYAAFSVALVLVTVYNAYLVLPFTLMWKVQVAQTNDVKADRCVSVLISNVLMENNDTDALRLLIKEHSPDIVFLAETDQKWVDALEDVAAEYPHVTRQPQDNHYGLMFMTRLPVIDVAVRYLVKNEMPSIRARLRTPGGGRFTFYGLHPEPPIFGQHSDLRDAELMLVAKEIKQKTEPTIIGGDLNDVAWSRTTRQFRRLSGVLDPRIGRGLYPSFHADYWFARWPLDHLFHTKDFELVELNLLKSIGSDHFPVFGYLSFAPDSELNEEPEPEWDTDEEEAERMIENVRDDSLKPLLKP